MPPAQTCTLVYSPTGHAWVAYGPLIEGSEVDCPETFNLASEDNPASRFLQLQDAVNQAHELGHEPTQWVNSATGKIVELSACSA